MKKYTVRFSSRASLAAYGQTEIYRSSWEKVRAKVHIRQKVVRHQPIDKLKDILIHILSGGKGMVEVNTGLRSETGLQRAFGRESCAEQSTLSQTLNACTEDNLKEMREALREIYEEHGQAMRHRFEKEWLILDVDLTGMPAGRQGEGVTKGFFSERKHRRGRQLGRVLASQYDEIVVEQLYAGNVQLEKKMQALMSAAEVVLQPGERRSRIIVRLDGGGGDDKDVNWLLERDYGVIAKVKNWQRSLKLAKQVEVWQRDPKDPSREVGWVNAPHAYVRPTRQLAIRSRNNQGEWRYRVLVFNLDDPCLGWMANQRAGDLDPMWAAMQAYDLRGGGVETSNRNSKSGLGLNKRNKRKFLAQEMLMLLAELAYNLLTWFRHAISKGFPPFARLGTARLIRNVLGISGKILFDQDGNLCKIILNQDHLLAPSFLLAFSHSLLPDGLYLILRKI